MIRRAATDSDLAGWCEVWSGITPREPVTLDEVKRRLEREPWRLYLVAEDGGAFVGAGFAGPTDSPDRVALDVRVLPRTRRRGLGSALYERALAHARSREPDWISCRVVESDRAAIAWVERRGFEEYDRQVELIRRVRGDERPPPPLPGIEIVEIDEGLLPAAYALTKEAWADLPTVANVEASPYEVWLEEEISGPVAFGATESGDLVGLAVLIDCAAPGLLEHGLTATKRTHRRRGIATALKQTQIAWAAANGYRELVTFTQDQNEGMQAINLALGYEPQPAWISMRRRP